MAIRTEISDIPASIISAMAAAGVASGNGPLPFWRLRRSPLLLRRGLQRSDVELYHLHHRSHRFGMLQDLANLLRHDLPAQAELVRQPAAGHGLATLKQLVPVAVDLGLVLARDGVRESRRERVRGATVEERHLLAHKFNGDDRGLSGGPGPHAARTQLAHLLRFRKYREIKLCGVFGVVVEPQK